MRLTEGRNAGFRKIINALNDNGSPPPIFRTDEDRLSFAVTIYRHPEFTDDDVKSGVGNGVGNGVESSVINDLNKQLSINEKKIIASIRKDPGISKKRISEKTGIALRTVDRLMIKLKNQGVIERQGPDKGGMWIIL
jgi:ATP-dependent DNA helicase RecG